MKKKIIWVVASCLMVLSLLMASCAPAPPAEEKVAPPKEKKEVVVTEEEVAPPPGEPVYGGWLNVLQGSPAYAFDEAFSIPPMCTLLTLTHEDLYTGDWSKGPAGTNEVSWMLPTILPEGEMPCLAESWEMSPDESSVTFHIRKGVHFHDKPPVNGREMTADDVAFTIERMALSDLPSPGYQFREAGENIKSVEATDRYTVVVKSNPKWIWRHLVDLVEVMRIVPREGGGPYPGDFRDWKKCIGTGPFMIVDEVTGSSLTYVKNPNYWRTDPIHPENILPYVDGINVLIITDRSTQLAALRTGKIDVAGGGPGGISWEDKESLVETNPELQWTKQLSFGQPVIGMRLDNPALPYDDVRVRRALAMALDRQAIARDYYGGNAEIFYFPVLPIKEFENMFVPLDELPESVQEQYEYNPEKARQLLAEAGYPDGFKTEIVCTAAQSDLLSVVKAMWADIGVDLELDVKEQATYQSIATAHTHKHMCARHAAQPDPFKLRAFVPGVPPNTSLVDDPHIAETYATKMVKDVWDWDELGRVMRTDIVPYVLEKCWYIDPPVPYTYTFWQPWLKGYHGESHCGHLNGMGWPPYVWIDQELKKEMTGR